MKLKFDTHINVELVISVVSVKYIYKYITKGPDRCIVTLKKGNESTEINPEKTKHLAYADDLGGGSKLTNLRN